MNISTKLLKAAAGQVGGAGLDVDEVFSTFLYDGTGSAQTITNNIDLSSEGGLTWFKNRGSAQEHVLFSSATAGVLSSDSTAAIHSASLQPTFNSNGFTLPNTNWGALNQTSETYVSWTFRKAPKFFDIVTWTGNATAGRTVSHNLGSVPGMIIVKCTSEAQHWAVYHRSQGATKYALLSNTDAFSTYAGTWNDTEPTSTEITLGVDGWVNRNGRTYVAYLFAHHANDGSETGFGPDGDSPVISCGSFTKGDTGVTNFINVDLGFEVQWLLTKSTASENWDIFDVQRGMSLSQAKPIRPNLSSAEGNFASRYIHPTSDGFAYQDNNDSTYIFMAVRRGSLFPPEAGDATKVFSVNETGTGDSPTNVWNIGFATDMNINTKTTGTTKYLFTRLAGETSLATNGSNAEGGASGIEVFDSATGTLDLNTNWWSTASNVISWSWKRAPSYFDVVAYNPTSTSNQTITHNLGVKPEMVWIKQREAVSGINRDWAVGMPDILGINNNTLSLNNNYANGTLNYNMFTQQPTATQFVLHGNENGISSNGGKYIAYLFATVAGVSKVGSFTGTGSDQNIDCGFSSGARFVLIKNTSNTDNWAIFDSVRGIVAGNDGHLSLNSTHAQASNTDYIDPHSSGFAVTGNDNMVNNSGDTYIFYAIA